MTLVPASVAVDMTAAEARAAVDAIRRDVDDLIERLGELWARRAWLALGYVSWEAMCVAEFPNRCLPKEERRAAVVSLRGTGMSTRAIAAATDTDHSTVVRDLSGGASAPPAVITGTDGKSYPTRGRHVENIRQLAKLGLSAVAIGEQLGITNNRVSKIARGAGITIRRTKSSPAARAERVERTRRLAAEGATSHQIAAELGVGYDVVRDYCRDNDIAVPADALTVYRKIDSARIVAATVDAIDGIDVMFDHIDYRALPVDEIDGWVSVLETSIRSLTTLKKHLKELTQP